MTEPRVRPVKTPEFAAEACSEGTTLAGRMGGTADINANAALDQFLRDLHKEAVRLRVAEVIIDLTKLEFVNSSCLKGFVTWICAVQDQPDDNQYRITFISSPAMPWQRRSLHALSCFASDLVTVRV